MEKKVVIIDNYDSFTYNLVHIVEELLDNKVTVVRNDEFELSDLEIYEYIILSPGPGIPEEAGLLKDVIKHYKSTKKIMGVCLGLQAIGEVYGAELLNLKRVWHGMRTSMIRTEAESILLDGISKEFPAGRYHSWVINPESDTSESIIRTRGKNTFNISTLSSFVVAGAGYKVTKHGNYGVSSVCGSSNVLEHLGYTFTNDTDQLKRQLDKSNICFLHAPLFHPALASVGPIRRQLGVKTFFNMLGPLVNPARPTRQSVGVFNLNLARLYAYLHEGLDKNYCIIHALDGYDEISLTGKAKVINNSGEYIVESEHFGLPQHRQEDIFGGDDIASAAKIFLQLLKNESTTEQKNAVLANSALAIQCFDPAKDIKDCVAEASVSIESGAAFTAFEKLVNN